MVNIQQKSGYLRGYEGARSYVISEYTTRAGMKKRCISLRPNYDTRKSRVYHERGNELYREGKFFDGYLSLRQGLVFDFNNNEARKHLAYSLQHLGYYDEALEQYQMAVAAEKTTNITVAGEGLRYFIQNKGYGVTHMLRRNQALDKYLGGDGNQKTVMRLLPAGKQQTSAFRKSLNVITFLLLFLTANVKATDHHSGESQRLAIEQLDPEKSPANVIHIMGSGHNLPFNNHPPDAAMHVWYEGDVIGSANLSDVDGSYSLTVSLTGIPGIANRGFMVRQNPFADRVEISFAVSGGLHHIRVMDIKGDIILQSDFNLAKGHHTLQLSGLGRGVRLATISNAAGGTETVKLIQTGSSFNPVMAINHHGSNRLKIGPSEDLLFEFFAPGHETYTHTEPAQPNMTVNYVLQQDAQSGVRSIVTETVDAYFSVSIPDVQVAYTDMDGGELVQGLTNNQGLFVGSFNHHYWVNWADVFDTVFELPSVTINASKNHYQSVSQVVPNLAQTVNLSMNPLLQQLQCNISGQVINANTGANLSAVLVTALDPDSIAINTTNTNSQGNYNFLLNYQLLEHPTNPALNQTTPDFFKLRFEKPDFITHTTESKSFAASVVHNQALTPEITITTTSFAFKPLTVRGEPQDPANIINFQHGNELVSVTVGNQTEINVTIESESTSDLIKIWYTPPSTNNIPIYNEAVIIHTQNRHHFEQPIANNNMTANRVNNNQTYDTLYVDRALINERYDLEVLAMFNYFEHPTYGRMYTNNDTIRQFIGTKSAGFICSHETYTQGSTNLDYFEVLHLTFDIRNGVPVGQWHIDAWQYGLIESLNASTREDGQKTFDWEINMINSIDDPKYVEAQNRNWKNTMRIVPDSQTTMPVNITSIDFPNKIIDYGRARGPPWSITVVAAIEETYEAMYGIADSNVSGTSSGAFLIEYVDNAWKINDMGKSIIQYRNQLKKGTQINLPPTATSSTIEDTIINYEMKN